MAKFTHPKSVDVMGEGEIAEEGEARPYQTKAAPVAPPFDMGQFAQMLASALAQSGTEQAKVLREALTGAAEMAREPIPEIKVHPNISAFNPEGERDHPNPGLKCEMFQGVYDDQQKIAPAFEYIQTTRAEQVALNAVEPGVYRVSRFDGTRGDLIVEGRRDADGTLSRMVFAFPHGWLAKDQHMYLPGPLEIARQIQEQRRAAH